MTAPVFTRTAAGSPLFALPVAAPVPAGYGIAFLPAADPGQDTLTLQQSWTSSPGIYLFLGQAVTDPQALAQAVRGYAGADPVRFLFIQNPADASSQWRAAQVQATVDAGTGLGTVYRAARINFGGYTLGIGRGCPVAIDSAGEGFTVTQAAAGAVFVQTPGGTATLAATGTLSLPLAGNAPGTLGADVPVPAAQWGALDACLRFFVDDPDQPGYLRGLACPVLTPPTAGLTLHAQLDPVSPLSPDRSILRFLDAGGGGGTALASGYRTVLGQTVQLTPATGSGFAAGPGLVFQVAPATVQPDPGDPYYLTYHGPFALGTAAQQVMCGISGVEYASVSAAAGHRMVFQAGQPAYAPPPGKGRDPLTGAAATAWCALAPAAAQGATYFAQPQQAAFYQSSQSAPAGGLAYLPVPAGGFPTTLVPPGGTGAPTLFPWAPYALAATADAQALHDVEVQSVSPARRAALSTFLLPTESSTPTGSRAGTTPQGLAVDFDQALGNWETVTLARHAGGTQLLQLSNVTDGLKGALQTDQMFCVVSRPDRFTASCGVVGTFSLTLSGWTFSLAPSAWATHRTMLILKCARRSVGELANDLSAWTWQAAAEGWSASSGSLLEVQRSLIDFLSDARERAKTEPEYRYFVRQVVDNPAWNGELFLRVDLSGALPPELAGLAAGIDPAQFMAHHVGITMTPLEVSGTTLVPHDSSLFALIAYDDPTHQFYQQVDYAYKVLSLKVLFLNSVLATFASRIELMINVLFGEAALLRGSGHGNNLILEGSYQQQGGEARYSFVQQGVNRFETSSAVLEAVETLSAQWVTLVPPAGTSSDVVRTEFRLTGDLQFRVLPGLDLFSFGPPPGTDAVGAGGLRFGGLLIRMSFPAATPSATVFAFDAGTLSLDPAASVARPASVFRGLPLRLQGFVQAADGVTPGEMGYMSVAAPLDASALEPPWYALAWQLELGTLGALAGNAGLTATLAAAWAPAPDEPLAYLGLKLPGSSSARPEIPIAGVLNLSFGALELVVDTSGPALAYLLMLRGIALSLLGMRFPPGQTDLYVFGDPQAPHSGSFGWYAAYAADDEEEDDGAGGSGGGRALRAVPPPALAAPAEADPCGCGTPTRTRA